MKTGESVGSGTLGVPLADQAHRLWIGHTGILNIFERVSKLEHFQIQIAIDQARSIWIDRCFLYREKGGGLFTVFVIDRKFVSCIDVGLQ